MKELLDRVGSLAAKHWPALIAFIGAAWVQFGTQITAYVAMHPKWAATFAFASFAITYYMHSPLPRKAWTEEQRAAALAPKQP